MAVGSARDRRFIGSGDLPIDRYGKVRRSIDLNGQTISNFSFADLDDGDDSGRANGDVLQWVAANTAWEAVTNLDLPGTLDVTGAATLDSTLRVDGALDLNADLNISGNIMGDGSGLSITGGDLAGETLSLTSNSADDSDHIEFSSPQMVYPSTRTLSEIASLDGFFGRTNASATYTVSASPNAALLAVVFAGTFEWSVDPNVFGMATLFNHVATQKNPSGSSRTWGPLNGFVDQPTWQVDTQTGQTMPVIHSFLAQPKIDNHPTNGGAGTLTDLFTFLARGTVEAGMTITNRQGVRVEEITENGTLTRNAGVVVANLSVGARNTQLLLGNTTTPAGDWAIYSDSTNASHFDGPIQLDEMSTPANPSAEDVVWYKKGDAVVWALNDGGTMSYVSLDLNNGTQAGITYHGATAP